MSISCGVRQRTRRREVERRAAGERRLARVRGDRYDRDADAVLHVERAGREVRSGDEHRRRAGLGGVAHAPLDRALIRLHDHGLAGDEADPVPCRRSRRARRPRQRAIGAVGLRQRRPATDATSKRRAVFSAAPPRTRTGPSRTVSSPTRSSASASSTSRRASSVPTASASAAAAGRRHVPNPGPGRPSFPTGATTSVPRAVAPAVGARLRAVGERRVGLHAADERNRRRVLDVAVAVGVDCTLEPGEQEVAAAEHGPAAVGRLLPAHHSDRQNARVGRDTLQS